MVPVKYINTVCIQYYTTMLQYFFFLLSSSFPLWNFKISFQSRKRGWQNLKYVCFLLTYQRRKTTLFLFLFLCSAGTSGNNVSWDWYLKTEWVLQPRNFAVPPLSRQKVFFFFLVRSHSNIPEKSILAFFFFFLN